MFFFFCYVPVYDNDPALYTNDDERQSNHDDRLDKLASWDKTDLNYSTR